jgi:CRISPR-associated endonuclease Csn1
MSGIFHSRYQRQVETARRVAAGLEAEEIEEGEEMQYKPYWLLDIGTNTVGFHICDLVSHEILDSQVIHRPDSEPVQFDKKTKKLSASPNLTRRMARQSRRQTDRRARRQVAVRKTLEQIGAAPGSAREVEMEANAFLFARGVKNPAAATMLHLRKLALDEVVPLNMLGAVFVSLAKRRGYYFLDDEESDAGAARASNTKLRKLLAENGMRTIGELGASGVPIQGPGIFSENQLHTEEFEAIYLSQQRFHSELTEDFHQQLRYAVFHKRPLRDCSHLVGKCALENNERRCPMFLPIAQRFRILDFLANIRVRSPRGLRNLTPDEHKKAVEGLDQVEKANLKILATWIDVPHHYISRVEDTGMNGNITETRLRKSLPDWTIFDQEKKNEILALYLLNEDRFAEAAATKGYVNLPHLETTYCSYSELALQKIVAKMEADHCDRFTAIDALYPKEERLTFDWLPPVLSEYAFPEERNPIVIAQLSVVKNLANKAIARFGKPAKITVEVAREFGETLAARKKRSKNFFENKQASEKLEASGIKPNQTNKQKYKLGQDCGWICPYCGQAMSPSSLFELQKEHIVPRSVWPSNEVSNLLLVHDECNHKRGNRPLAEAFPDTIEQVYMRIDATKNDRRSRIARMGSSEWSDFSSSQLPDTRNITKMTCAFFRLLGEEVKIETIRGATTDQIRRALGMPKKNRADFRNHAEDAMLLAFGERALMDYYYQREHGDPDAKIKEPFTGYFQKSMAMIEAIQTEHIVNRRIRGPLHTASIYPKDCQDKRVVKTLQSIGKDGRLVVLRSNYAIVINDTDGDFSTQVLSTLDVLKDKSLVTGKKLLMAGDTVEDARGNQFFVSNISDESSAASPRVVLFPVNMATKDTKDRIRASINGRFFKKYTLIKKERSVANNRHLELCSTSTE